MAVVDALGYLARFVNLLGQAHDLTGVPDLLKGLPFGPLVGDKAFNVEWRLGDIEARGAEAVIPSRRNRTAHRHHDQEMYKWRPQIENFFARIKEFRAVATRHNKTDERFAAAT